MNTSYQPNAMTGRSTQLREAQRESGRCELSWTNCGSSPRAVNQTVYPVWSTRPERTCQVGFNVSSTLQEHSISVLTKCRARLWIQVVPRKTFSPWANKPRAFFTIFRYQGQKVVRACFNLSHQTRRPTLGRISAAPFCPTLYSPIHSSEIYLFSGAFAGVVVTLSAWKSALFRKISLSEPHLRRVWDFSERF